MVNGVYLAGVKEIRAPSTLGIRTRASMLDVDGLGQGFSIGGMGTESWQYETRSNHRAPNLTGYNDIDSLAKGSTGRYWAIQSRCRKAKRLRTPGLGCREALMDRQRTVTWAVGVTAGAAS